MPYWAFWLSAYYIPEIVPTAVQYVIYAIIASGERPARPKVTSTPVTSLVEPMLDSNNDPHNFVNEDDDDEAVDPAHLLVNTTKAYARWSCK